MYFWKTNLVAIALRENTLTQGMLKNYYLATSIIGLIAIYLGGLSPRENLAAYAIEAIACILLVFFGINAAYRANGGVGGVRFLDKMVVLSFPLLIKVLAASFVFGFIGAVVMEVLGVSASYSEWFLSLLVIVLQAVFLWRLVVHVKTTNIASD